MSNNKTQEYTHSKQTGPPVKVMITDSHAKPLTSTSSFPSPPTSSASQSSPSSASPPPPPPSHSFPSVPSPSSPSSQSSSSFSSTSTSSPSSFSSTSSQINSLSDLKLNEKIPTLEEVFDKHEEATAETLRIINQFISRIDDKVTPEKIKKIIKEALIEIKNDENNNDDDDDDDVDDDYIVNELEHKLSEINDKLEIIVNKQKSSLTEDQLKKVLKDMNILTETQFYSKLREELDNYIDILLQKLNKTIYISHAQIIIELNKFKQYIIDANVEKLQEVAKKVIAMNKLINITTHNRLGIFEGNAVEDEGEGDVQVSRMSDDTYDTMESSIPLQAPTIIQHPNFENFKNYIRNYGIDIGKKIDELKEQQLKLAKELNDKHTVEEEKHTDQYKDLKQKLENIVNNNNHKDNLYNNNHNRILNQIQSLERKRQEVKVNISDEDSKRRTEEEHKLLQKLKNELAIMEKQRLEENERRQVEFKKWQDLRSRIKKEPKPVPVSVEPQIVYQHKDKPKPKPNQEIPPLPGLEPLQPVNPSIDINIAIKKQLDDMNKRIQLIDKRKNMKNDKEKEYRENLVRAMMGKNYRNSDQKKFESLFKYADMGKYGKKNENPWWYQGNNRNKSTSELDKEREARLKEREARLKEQMRLKELEMELKMKRKEAPINHSKPNRGITVRDEITAKPGEYKTQVESGELDRRRAKLKEDEDRLQKEKETLASRRAKFNGTSVLIPHRKVAIRDPVASSQHLVPRQEKIQLVAKPSLIPRSSIVLRDAKLGKYGISLAPKHITKPLADRPKTINDRLRKKKAMNVISNKIVVLNKHLDNKKNTEEVRVSNAQLELLAIIDDNSLFAELTEEQQKILMRLKKSLEVDKAIIKPKRRVKRKINRRKKFERELKNKITNIIKLMS